MTKSGLKNNYTQLMIKVIKGQRATDAFNLIKQAQSSISRALDTLNL